MTFLPDKLPAVDAEVVILDVLLHIQADNFGIPCQDVPLAIPPDTLPRKSKLGTDRLVADAFQTKLKDLISLAVRQWTCTSSQYFQA